MRQKILYVIGSLERGGAELHLLNILPVLKNNHGWQPSVFCLGHAGELADKFLELGIPVITPPIESDGVMHNYFYRVARLGLALIKLWYFLWSKNQKIVHFFLPLSYIAGSPIALLAIRKHLVMSRRSLNHYQNKRKGIKFIEYMFHYSLSACLGNSKAVMKDLVNENMSKDKLRLIYNGIPLVKPTLSEPEVRDKLGISNDELVFIIVANLLPYKGHATLLEALSDGRQKFNKEWCLLIVGEDRDIQDSLEAQADNSKISDNIKWLGSRRDIINLLSASDIGVLSSYEEGFSNSILESMMVGLPLVVTDVGGNSEAVINGETGFTVPAKNSQKMSDALVKLANDSDLRKKMGDSARDRISQYFTLEECAHKYHKIYKAILNQEPLPVFDSY